MTAGEPGAKRPDSGKRSVLRRKRLLLVLGVAVTSIMLVSLLVVVPFVFGGSFLSFSFKLYYMCGGRPNWRVVYTNGSTVNISALGIKIYFANNYFMPIYIKFNGILHAMLVYNRSVENPADIEFNRAFLIWGGWVGYLQHESELSGSGYAYYISRKNLTNFTDYLVPGPYYTDFCDDGSSPVWRSLDLNGNPVPAGNYSIYSINYGQAIGPINLTVVQSHKDQV